MLLLHAGIVVFVVGGLVAVLLGARSRVLLALHAAAVAVVVVQAWLGQVCPLTTLEVWLRRQARQGAYEGGFIEHWVSRLLYYDAPPWVFTVAYTAFGLLTAWAWRRALRSK